MILVKWKLYNSTMKKTGALTLISGIYCTQGPCQQKKGNLENLPFI